MGEGLTHALTPSEPRWLGSMLREIATAQAKRMPMRWPVGLKPEGGETDLQALRKGLDSLFAHFESQPFRGPVHDLPEIPESERGLPEPDEMDGLVKNFEAFMDIAMRRQWVVELVVSYDERGYPMYHVLGKPHIPSEEFVPLGVVRYYLADAVAHALVEVERYGKS